MTKPEFIKLLNEVSMIAYTFAKKYLKNRLCPEFRYDVFLNESFDGNSSAQFDTYPQDDGRLEEGLTAREVSDLLYRNSKVPVWIDISVFKSDENTTTFKLLCAGRYTDNKEELYYQNRGTGPFGIKSPDLPFDYEEGKKFMLKTKT